MPSPESLEAILAKGNDSALLRFSLGDVYLREGQAERAVEHLAKAVELDTGYSAAWKLYGKSLVAANRLIEAREVYQAGIEVAERKGDKQAQKEMQVFLRRVEKSLAAAVTPPASQRD